MITENEIPKYLKQKGRKKVTSQRVIVNQSTNIIMKNA